MTQEEIKNKAKETSGGNYYYEQGFFYGFELGEENGRKDLEKEIKQITEREHVVPEHYLCEMIDKNKELKAQIEKMKTCSRCMSNNKDLEEYPCKNCFKDGVYTNWH